MPQHKAFLGDQERTFKLTPALIRELERVTGCGIGFLHTRVRAWQFHHADVVETIRLALIGGGTSQKEAKALVDAYVVDRPFGEALVLALDILLNLFDGEAPAEPEPENSTDNEDNSNDE